MTYGLDVQQLRELVIRPALQHIGLWSQAAENLVLGTALTESGLRALKQQPGPALGLWQMEPSTHADHWKWLDERALGHALQDLLLASFWPSASEPNAQELCGNLYYAAAMCRVHYYRVPTVLPGVTDASRMAHYWKRYYNSARGKGTVAKALPHFVHACA